MEGRINGVRKRRVAHRSTAGPNRPSKPRSRMPGARCFDLGNSSLNKIRRGLQKQQQVPRTGVAKHKNTTTSRCDEQARKQVEKPRTRVVPKDENRRETSRKVQVRSIGHSDRHQLKSLTLRDTELPTISTGLQKWPRYSTVPVNRPCLLDRRSNGIGFIRFAKSKSKTQANEQKAFEIIQLNDSLNEEKKLKVNTSPSFCETISKYRRRGGRSVRVYMANNWSSLDWAGLLVAQAKQHYIKPTCIRMLQDRPH